MIVPVSNETFVYKTGESRVKLRVLKNKIMDQVKNHGYNYRPPMGENEGRHGVVCDDFETDKDHNEPAAAFHFNSSAANDAKDGETEDEVFDKKPMRKSSDTIVPKYAEPLALSRATTSSVKDLVASDELDYDRKYWEGM